MTTRILWGAFAAIAVVIVAIGLAISEPGPVRRGQPARTIGYVTEGGYRVQVIATPHACLYLYNGHIAAVPRGPDDRCE